MIVCPKEKLPGSTSVACWLVALVKVSVLNFTKGTVAAGKDENWLLELELDPDPQRVEAKISVLKHRAAKYRANTLTRIPLAALDSERHTDKLHTAGNPVNLYFVRRTHVSQKSARHGAPSGLTYPVI